jgi:hypothetical protein
MQRTRLVAAGLVAFLSAAGCATVVEGRYTKIGEADRSGDLKTERGARLPVAFSIQPADVAAKYGRLCKPKQSCTYFVDDKNYYLVADYGQVPSRGSIAQAACPVVNGANGTLLKIC